MSKTPEQNRTKSTKVSHRARDVRVRARTPAQIARQQRVFALSVYEHKTYREIAAELSIALETVVNDARCEQKRRDEEKAAAHPKPVVKRPKTWWS